MMTDKLDKLIFEVMKVNELPLEKIQRDWHFKIHPVNQSAFFVTPSMGDLPFGYKGVAIEFTNKAKLNEPQLVPDETY